MSFMNDIAGEGDKNCNAVERLGFLVYIFPMSKRKKKAAAWKPALLAFLFLGIGLAAGAGFAVFFAEKPTASKAVLALTKPAAIPLKIKPKPQWVQNAMPSPLIEGQPMIAIILDDLGLNPARATAATRLSGPLTLAFLPYANALEEQTAQAHAAGHELLVHVPMEPEGKNGDPGPHALMADMEPDEILDRLRWDLGRFKHYVGINNHMGSKFTKDRKRLSTVFGELKARGLLFIDSRTTVDTVAKKLAKEMAIPFAERQVFLDNYRSAENVRARLNELESIARREGAAIGIGHPHKVTLTALREWLPTLSGKGFVLVPVSTIVRKQLAD